MGLSNLAASRAGRVTLVMACWFAANGVVLPFLPRWLEVERGLDGAGIGAVLALAQMARIGTGPMIAFWGDGAADRRTPLRALSLAAIAAYAGFFLVRDFWALLALGFVALTLTQSMTPFIEAATLRATQEGRFSYGVARGIGSTAFILGNLLGGLLIARFGLGAVVAWVLTSLALGSAASWFALLRDPAPGDAAARSTEARASAVRALLRNPRFVILIVSCGLIQAAHAFYYGFSTLVWRGQGLTPDVIGQLWAFGVTIEVAFLLSLPLIERRVAPEALILMGAGGALVRWTLMGFMPTGLALWPLQMLHALSFAAAHVGAMRLIFREAPDLAAGVAQTLYAALAAGLLMGLATFGSGFLYDAAGGKGYWAMAAMAAAGGALACLLLTLPARPAKA